MADSHTKFLSELEKSHQSVFIACLWFRKRGYHIHLDPIREAPTKEEWAGYSDAGDMMVERGGMYLLVEVKRINRPWKDGKWPFSDFIVDGVGNWDRKEPKPDLYWVLSPCMKYVAIYRIEDGDPDDWYRKSGDNIASGNPQEFYATTLKGIKFYETNIG